MTSPVDQLARVLDQAGAPSTPSTTTTWTTRPPARTGRCASSPRTSPRGRARGRRCPAGRRSTGAPSPRCRTGEWGPTFRAGADELLAAMRQLPEDQQGSVGFQVAEYAAHSWDLVRGHRCRRRPRRLPRRDRARRDAAGADRREPREAPSGTEVAVPETPAPTRGSSRSPAATPGPDPRSGIVRIKRLVGRLPDLHLDADYTPRRRRRSQRSPISTAIAAATPRPIIHEMSRLSGASASPKSCVSCCEDVPSRSGIRSTARLRGRRRPGRRASRSGRSTPTPGGRAR